MEPFRRIVVPSLTAKFTTSFDLGKSHGHFRVAPLAFYGKCRLPRFRVKVNAMCSLAKSLLNQFNHTI